MTLRRSRLLNRRKHGVAFEQAATVFRDPRAVSVFDDAHSGKEERWITLWLMLAEFLLPLQSSA